MTAPTRRWISVKECGAYLGMRGPAIRRLIYLGKIPSARLGRNVFVDMQRLEQTLDGQSRKAKP